MSDNPFKDEEPMSVFKEASIQEELKKTSLNKQDNHQEEKGYSQFPKWDLLPPFKLIKRGKNK